VVICAALGPDLAAENWPQEFREDAAKIITEFAKQTDHCSLKKAPPLPVQINRSEA